MTPIVSGMLCESDFTLMTDPIIIVNYWANYKNRDFLRITFGAQSYAK